MRAREFSSRRINEIFSLRARSIAGENVSVANYLVGCNADYKQLASCVRVCVCVCASNSAAMVKLKDCSRTCREGRVESC